MPHSLLADEYGPPPDRLLGGGYGEPGSILGELMDTEKLSRSMTPRPDAPSRSVAGIKKGLMDSLMDSLTDAEWSLILNGGGSGATGRGGTSLGVGGNATLGVEMPLFDRQLGLAVDASGGAGGRRPSALARKYGDTDENFLSGQFDGFRATLGDKNREWSFETDSKLGLGPDRKLMLRYTGRF